jgi:hypothetical protein
VNKPQFVKEFKETHVTLPVGLGGDGIPATMTKFSFILEVENKITYTFETFFRSGKQNHVHV